MPLEKTISLISTTKKEEKIKNIKSYGLYPIVSQSRNLIDGYSNDSKKVISEKPVVVFGDHTRNVKFIDFNFVPGADGIKVMQSDKLEGKFLYYCVLYASFRIENRGYNRHFSILKKCKIPVPKISTQIEIIAALDLIFSKLEQINSI